ncbi:unnamed protein product [Brugia pahangi]|uniref:Uncharacterized protein n=1 Tax=Brugia pahangi TaxID=6280 RepID=A0A0N4T7P8_BRUPA|nr:unnamed protein product [Brugia pahangi]
MISAKIKIRNGINNLHLIDTKLENKSKENNNSPKEEMSQSMSHHSRNMQMSSSYNQRPLNWGIDPKVIYGWGNISSITKIRNGINNLHLIDTKLENKSKENNNSPKEEMSQSVSHHSRNMQMSSSYNQRPLNWGIDPKVIYGWGNISSITKLIFNRIFLIIAIIKIFTSYCIKLLNKIPKK